MGCTDSTKRSKYNDMAKAAAKHLDQDVTFQPFAYTMQGLLSEGAHKVLDFISASVRAADKGERRRDGLTTDHVVRDFDRRLRNELAATIARGWGSVLRAAGRRLPCGPRRNAINYYEALTLRRRPRSLGFRGLY